MARIGKFSAMAAVALGVASLAAASVAQDKSAILKERQDFMKAQSADTKAINDYAKGMGDKASAQKAADDLIARSSKIVALFPAGTSTADFPGKTNAKPEIWTDRAKFESVPVALKGLATKVSDTVKTGTPADVGLAAADLGKNGCGACHGTFRVPLQH
jgi:cytochrome c556